MIEASARGESPNDGQFYRLRLNQGQHRMPEQSLRMLRSIIKRFHAVQVVCFNRTTDAMLHVDYSQLARVSCQSFSG